MPKVGINLTFFLTCHILVMQALTELLSTSRHPEDLVTVTVLISISSLGVAGSLAWSSVLFVNCLQMLDLLSSSFSSITDFLGHPDFGALTIEPVFYLIYLSYDKCNLSTLDALYSPSSLCRTPSRRGPSWLSKTTCSLLTLSFSYTPCTFRSLVVRAPHNFLFLAALHLFLLFAVPIQDVDHYSSPQLQSSNASFIVLDSDYFLLFTITVKSKNSRVQK